jgi:hypothetical protein
MWRKAAGFLFAVVGCVPVAIAPLRPIAAAGECLVAPGNETPKGYHWRGRSEQGTGRQCWYLQRDRAPSSSQAAAASAPAAASPPPAAPVPIPAQRPVVGETTMPAPVADARDELTRPPAETRGLPSAPMPLADPPAESRQEVPAIFPPRQLQPSQQFSQEPGREPNRVPMLSAPPDASSSGTTRVEAPVSPTIFIFMVVGALIVAELAASTLFPLWHARRRSKVRPAQRRQTRSRSRLDAPSLSPEPLALADADRYPRPFDREARPDHVERLLGQLADRERAPVVRPDSRRAARASR